MEDKEVYIGKSFTVTESIMDKIFDVQMIKRTTNTSLIVREALIIGLNAMKGETEKDGEQTGSDKKV